MRAFFALPLPESVQQELALKCAGTPGARWVPAEAMHITLRFIGEIDPRASDDLAELVSAWQIPRFSLRLQGCGHFGDRRRARILWFGVHADDILVRLQKKLERALIQMGFAPEGRKFKPHVTLARMKDMPLAGIENFLRDNSHYQSAPFEADCFVLYSSHRVDNGPYYRAEYAFPLGD